MVDEIRFKFYFGWGAMLILSFLVAVRYYGRYYFSNDTSLVFGSETDKTIHLQVSCRTFLSIYAITYKHNPTPWMSRIHDSLKKGWFHPDIRGANHLTVSYIIAYFWAAPFVFWPFRFAYIMGPDSGVMDPDSGVNFRPKEQHNTQKNDQRNVVRQINLVLGPTEDDDSEDISDDSEDIDDEFEDISDNNSNSEPGDDNSTLNNDDFGDDESGMIIIVMKKQGGGPYRRCRRYRVY